MKSFEPLEPLKSWIDYSMWLPRRRAAMSQDSRSTGWTRREALGMLGMGAVAAALPGIRFRCDRPRFQEAPSSERC